MLIVWFQIMDNNKNKIAVTCDVLFLPYSTCISGTWKYSHVLLNYDFKYDILCYEFYQKYILNKLQSLMHNENFSGDITSTKLYLITNKI